MCREQPLVHRNVRALEDRSHGRSELLAAFLGAAAVKTKTGGFADDRISVVHAAAVRADWTIRPADSLEMRPRGSFIVEDGIGEID